MLRILAIDYLIIILFAFVWFSLEHFIGNGFALFPSEIRENNPEISGMEIVFITELLIFFNPIWYIFKLLHWLTHHRRDNNENETRT